MSDTLQSIGLGESVVGRARFGCEKKPLDLCACESEEHEHGVGVGANTTLSDTLSDNHQLRNDFFLTLRKKKRKKFICADSRMGLLFSSRFMLVIINNNFTFVGEAIINSTRLSKVRGNI